MTLNRYAARRDATEDAIVNALRKAGCHVMRGDIVDLWILRGSKIYPLECKSKGGRLTHSQELMIAAGWPLKVVHNAAEALQAVGL